MPPLPPLLAQRDLKRVDTFTPDFEFTGRDPGTSQARALTARGLLRGAVGTLHDITRLTGGSGSLAAAPTLGEQPGKLVSFVLDGQLQTYRLAVGNPVAVEPEIIYPSDRGTSPNNRYWQRVSTGASSGAGATILPSATPPTDTSVLWMDVADGTLSAWNGNVWVVVAGYLAGGATVTPSVLDQLFYGTHPLLFGTSPLTYTTS